MVHIRAQVHMINPDVCAGLNANGITSIGQDLADGNVADDDVGNILDVQRNTLQLRAGVDTEDRFVASNTCLASAADGTFDVDDSRPVSFGRSGEGRERRNSSGSASSATGGATLRQHMLEQID